MRLEIITVGYQQSEESIKKGWFIDDSLKSCSENVNHREIFLTSAALKGIFSLLIDNNLIYYAEIVPKPFAPKRHEN